MVHIEGWLLLVLWFALCAVLLALGTLYYIDLKRRQARMLPDLKTKKDWHRAQKDSK